MSRSSPLISSDGLTRDDAYYQHGTTTHADIEEDRSWRITDFGNVRQRSRDGSIHATDEVFNAASHLAALILSILGSAILVVDASAQGEPWKIVSFAIYGASLIFLFGSSTLHHAIEGPWEDFLRMLDYFAIYPLIAGTFTPLCLVFYHQDPVGWTFFGTIWGLALVGMILTASCITRVPKWLSMTLYITLGWLGACFTYWVSLHGMYSVIHRRRRFIHNLTCVLSRSCCLSWGAVGSFSFCSGVSCIQSVRVDCHYFHTPTTKKMLGFSSP